MDQRITEAFHKMNYDGKTGLKVNLMNFLVILIN